MEKKKGLKNSKKMNNQGKRPSQIKFSEEIVFYGILGMLVVLLITFIINILNKL
jgi:hypothetical protein